MLRFLKPRGKLAKKKNHAMDEGCSSCLGDFVIMSEFDLPAFIEGVSPLWVGAGVFGVLVLWILLRRPAPVVASPMGGAELQKQLQELNGRLAQMSEQQQNAQSHLQEQIHKQERVLAQTLGEGLLEQTRATAKQMSSLNERLAVIDQAQRNIMDLSQQMVGLQDILANKQTRGAFGEVQLEMLVSNSLPPSAFKLQSVLSNGKRVDCLLSLPNPPGAICIDAKFPLESYRALQAAEDKTAKQTAGRQFKADLLKHINDIAQKYIIPGETAESALMFLPSEAVYAELHANFADVVDHSYRAKVWVVSPTTLMATLNTVRAILKDARLREEAGRIQQEITALLDDVGRLDDRVAALQRHFDQSNEDIRKIRISTEKITKRGERIEEIQLDDASVHEELEPSRRRLGTS